VAGIGAAIEASAVCPTPSPTLELGHISGMGSDIATRLPCGLALRSVEGQILVDVHDHFSKSRRLALVVMADSAI
jgi:hypothetical protein